MRAWNFGLAVALLMVLSSIGFAQAQELGSTGKIYSMTVTPDTPVVYDPITISIGVNNPTESEASYKLEVIVTKDGEIKSNQPFTFTLPARLGTFVAPVFVPSDIGQYEVVAKLTDSYNIGVKDLRVEKVNVVSEIGPFDVAIDSPSEVITPGEKTPLILTLANMGEKATDVQVKVTLECDDQPDISQELFVFLYPGSVQDKQISTDTCKETGPHDITASIIVFNRTWISAVNQIFLNESTTSLVFDPPEFMTVRAGISNVFDVKVTNAGDRPIDNVRLLIPRIPQEWLTITPEKIVKVDPRQTVLFIVNVTPIRDAEEAEFEVAISAAADQVLERRDSSFKVVKFDGKVPEKVDESQVVSEGQPGISLPGIPADQTVYIGVVVVVAVGAMVGGMRLGRYRSAPNKAVMQKAERISSDEKLNRVFDTLSRRKK